MISFRDESGIRTWPNRLWRLALGMLPSGLSKERERERPVGAIFALGLIELIISRTDR